MTHALVVVDVQNDFCEGGSLPAAGGGEVAAGITAFLRDRGGDYGYVVATRDWHVDPGEHFAAEPDFVRSWPPHCVVGTPGARFHPAFDVSRLAAVFNKGEYAAAYSGFEGATESGERLADWLRARDVDRIDVVGIATDHCVRATALDAVRQGFAARVLLDLTAGVAPGTVASALDELESAGVELTGAPLVRSE